jgi:hypothetical protein
MPDLNTSAAVDTFMQATTAAAARTALGLGTASTTNVPATGNAGTTEVVKGDDTRLANSRTPSTHASTHAFGAADPITIALGSQVSGTLPVANGGTGRAVGNYSVYGLEIHVGKDGSDTTGDGTLINPVLTITKALTLIGSGRNTIVVHPGGYSESPTVSGTNTTITTTELTGANTLLSGTLTLSAAARVSGLKMSNLTITGTGNAYISNCTVDTRVIKSGSNYVEIINSELQCASGIQITGAGAVSIIGNKCWSVAVSNAAANVLLKDCFQVIAPSVTAGSLQFDGCAIFAAAPTTNAVTSSAGTTITLANSFVLNSVGANVERVSLLGSYSILNLVYDKTNSTLTGTNLNAIDYFSVVNADTLNLTNGLSVANGGTGATTASGARTALSAALSGANTDINSVALTTGTVSTSPSASTDIVNKAYADAIGSGVNFHDACDYATIAALSPSATYAQPGGATVGVGATLTGSANTALQVDGATVSVGQRILVKNQATTFQNGIYTVTRQGNGATVPYILTRASDYDTSGTGTNEVQAGDFILVLSGTISNTAWVQQTTGAITFGTTALSFTQFSTAAAVAGVSSFSGGSTGLTPNTASTGAVQLAGTLAIANGGTGAASAQSAISSLGVGMRMVEAQTNVTNILGTMVGNTFTVTATGVFTTDGYTPVLGDIIAFALQGGGSSNQNGFWEVTTVGAVGVSAVFTRPSWFTGTVKNGMYMPRFGATQGGYVMAFFGPGGNTDITVGTTVIQVVRVNSRIANATTSINLFTGYQSFRANGTGANQAPFFFQTGAALMTTPQANAVEWFNDTMYLTNAAGVRDNVLTQNSFGTY